MIAILGGTFDPIHNGHLRLALNLKQRIGFSAVHFIPSAQPPHRDAPQRTAEQRYQMVQLAVKDHADFYANDCELQRHKPSYMLDTLIYLRKKWGKKQAIALILGSDAFQYLPTWHRWQQLLDLCHLLVVARPGELPLSQLLSPDFLNYVEQHQTQDSADLHKQAGGYIHLQTFPDLDISASFIRQTLAEQDSAAFLMPTTVLNYIQQQGCYRYASKLANNPNLVRLKAFINQQKTDHEIQALICLSLAEIADLLYSADANYCQFAMRYLIHLYQTTDKAKIFNFTWQHRHQFNSEYLANQYASHILGDYLQHQAKAPLYQLAYSADIWQQYQALMTSLSLSNAGLHTDAVQILSLFSHSKKPLLLQAYSLVLQQLLNAGIVSNKAAIA